MKLLSYMGYLELDYSKIENEVMTALDLDKNGKVDTDDIQELWNRTMKASDKVFRNSESCCVTERTRVTFGFCL